jgi:hypothetical protein
LGNGSVEYKEQKNKISPYPNLSLQNYQGKLNPRWVETLMGLPLGWTSPDAPASLIANWKKFVSGWLKAQTEQTS